MLFKVLGASALLKECCANGSIRASQPLRKRPPFQLKVGSDSLVSVCEHLLSHLFVRLENPVTPIARGLTWSSFQRLFGK